MRETTIEAIERRIERTESCWNWIGRITSDGYGTLGKRMAHRLAYELIGIKKIPEGLQIDHLCRNRKCVNPDHLEAVTSAENTRRGVKPNPKPNCRSGHLFTPDNTRYLKNGNRSCRKCTRRHKIEVNAVRKGHAFREINGKCAECGGGIFGHSMPKTIQYLKDRIKALEIELNIARSAQTK